MRKSLLFHGLAAIAGITSVVAMVGFSGIGSASIADNSSHPILRPTVAMAAEVPSPFVRLRALGAAAAATPTPAPVYVTSYSTVVSGSTQTFVTQLQSFNTTTKKFTKITSFDAYPEAATLSGDGNVLYLSSPYSSTATSGQKGELYAFSMTPTSATLLGSNSYLDTNFELAYAGNTGSGSVTDTFLDIQSSGSSSFTLDNNALAPFEAGPSLAGYVDWVFSVTNGNAYILTSDGAFYVYDESKNSLSKPILNITTGVPPGVPVLAVLPNNSQVYAISNSSTGKTSNIDVIDPVTPALVKQIPISFPTYEVLVDHAGANVYAIGQQVVNDNPIYYVAVISPTTDSVTKTFVIPDSTLFGLPYVAVMTDGTHLLLTCNTSSAVAKLDVVNPGTETLTASIPLPLGPGNAPVSASQVVTIR